MKAVDCCQGYLGIGTLDIAVALGRGPVHVDV